ncbi:hypothetical protein NFI96_026330, partial [Prochilodus magdalenae]
YRTVVRPSYKVVYRTITALEWKCCPGYSGTHCDEEWQRVIFSDESRFSLGGDAQRIGVWRLRGQHQDERIVVTRPEGLVSLHLHPYRTICRNCVRMFKLHGMDYHRTPLGTSTAPYRDVCNPLTISTCPLQASDWLSEKLLMCAAVSDQASVPSCVALENPDWAPGLNSDVVSPRLSCLFTLENSSPPRHGSYMQHCVTASCV